MGATRDDDPAIYGDAEERPPWIEEATDPTWWDVAFGSYGDGYLEWVVDHYFWDPLDPRTVADTRSLWAHRRHYAASEFAPFYAMRDGEDAGRRTPAA